MADTATTTRAPAAADDQAPAKARRRNLLLLLGGIVAIGLVGYGAYWALVGSHYVSTDNAYVGADTAEITPLVSAPVLRVLVGETQQVHVGDVLVELDPADAQLALTQAQAALARAQSDYSRARVDLGRRQALAPGGAVSRDEITSAQNNYTATSAAVAAARAQVETAQLAVTRSTIRSPIDGVVSNKNVQVGQRVAAGSPIMVIAPVASAYVDANFKENQLRDVTVGQPVTLHSDLYGGSVTYHGRVAGFSGGTGSAFSLIPAQNASGNWIKVVQRVPVRITLDPRELAQHPLRVGMSMDASIDISAQH